MKKILLIGALSASLLAADPAGEVVSFGNFIHVVGSLEKSLAFYHDALGLEMQGQAPASRPFAANLPVAMLYGTPETQSRFGVVRLPNTPAGLEFGEFKDLNQKVFTPRVQDPGATVLVLKVKSLDAALAKVREAGAPIVSLGANPISGTFVVKDPDGFYVQFVKPENAAEATAPGNVIGAGMMVTVNDLDQTVHLYRDLIGFDPHIDATFAKDDALSKALGVAGALYRHAIGNVPGTTFQVDFVEFKGLDRKLEHSHVFDRGSGILRLRVKDVDSFVTHLKQGGVTVASAGGDPVLINNNQHFCILRDPNNFFFQIAPAPAPRPQ